MPETRIEADVVYDHERYGEVLVTGIAKVYNAWDTTGPTDDVGSGSVQAYFYDNFDGYGGMNPMPMSEHVNEFAKSVDRVGVHDYINMNELQE